MPVPPVKGLRPGTSPSSEISVPGAAFLASDSAMRSTLPDERTGSAGVVPMSFYEEGPHAGQVGGDSTRVGFTLRNSENQILDAFAFRLNPQGLGYTLGSRASMSAVKSGIYVDDFGPAASTIAMRQLVMNGKNAYLEGPYYTAREDVQRFLKRIYLPAIAGVGKTRRRVFFHDHHFERGFEQRIFFPPGSLQIERSVETPGLWRVELQMVSLEKYPYGEVEAERAPDARGNKQYKVKRGDTLEKLARKMAGKSASRVLLQITTIRLLELNPQIAKKRRVPGDSASEKSGKPMRIYPGEILALP